MIRNTRGRQLPLDGFLACYFRGKAEHKVELGVKIRLSLVGGIARIDNLN